MLWPLIRTVSRVTTYVFCWERREIIFELSSIPPLIYCFKLLLSFFKCFGIDIIRGCPSQFTFQGQDPDKLYSKVSYFKGGTDTRVYRTSFISDLPLQLTWRWNLKVLVNFNGQTVAHLSFQKWQLGTCKHWQSWVNGAVFRVKAAAEMLNSVDPDQTAPIEAIVISFKTPS